MDPLMLNSSAAYLAMLAAATCIRASAYSKSIKFLSMFDRSRAELCRSNGVQGVEQSSIEETAVVDP
jgi:hypothetical protein